ncbi:MAG: hypothetical protein HYV29_07325 [Ignavibacteriales bacterium]|nr:hypothetical protein [Ignavibacteriales bacterium]
MHFQKTNPTVFISFGIAKQGQTTLRVYRFGTRKLVATLVDTILPAGQYSIFFDTKDLTNGMYVYQLHAESLFVQKKLALMNPDLSQLSQTQPLAKTEGTGKFQIPFSVLGIGEEIFYTNGIGETLGSFTLDSISVVIFQKEKPAVLVEGFSIDPNQNLIRTFTIK